MTADRSGVRVSATAGLSGRFLTDRRLKLCFALLLAVTTAARVLLSVFPKTAVTYNDELFYLEIAQNLWRSGTLTIYSAPIRFSKIFYSVLISPFYAVSDGVLRTQLISGFNALLISFSLIPGWLLARRILKNNGQILLALLILALSPNLLFTVTFMAENLYIPLLLWAFYAVYRILSSEKPSPAGSLFLGILALLLYYTKETGAAFLFGTAIVLLYSRFYAPLLLTITGFGIPWLILKLTVFRGLGYTYSEQISLPAASGASQIMFLCFGCFLMLLFFLVSALWFPVALPFTRYRKLAVPNRRFLLFSSVYVLALSFGVTYGVLMHDGSMTTTPQIHLRYFVGAAYPFLLLFFSSLASGAENNWFRKIAVSTLVFSACLLLFFFVPRLGSLVDHPLLHLFHEFRLYAVSDIGICKALFLLFTALSMYLLARKQKAAVSLLVCTMVILEFASGYSFYRAAKNEEQISDNELLADVRQLDQIMDEWEGQTLLIVQDLHQPVLKLLNTISDNNYAVVTSDEVNSFITADNGLVSAAFTVDSKKLRVPYPRFALTENYDLPSIEQVITMEPIPILNPYKYSEISGQSLNSFHVFRTSDPSGLHLIEPRAWPIGQTVLFYGDDPQYFKYDPTGFSSQEEEFTWSGSNEVTLTLCPMVEDPCNLMFTWTWQMTLGEQNCEIYANDIPIRSEELSSLEKDMIFYVPAEYYADTGLLTLRFVFPNAKEPGNGDTRTLAVAFRTLTLDIGY